MRIIRVLTLGGSSLSVSRVHFDIPTSDRPKNPRLTFASRDEGVGEEAAPLVGLLAETVCGLSVIGMAIRRAAVPFADEWRTKHSALITRTRERGISVFFSFNRGMRA
jgi:hypothetical protein